MQLVVKLLN